MRRDRVIDIIQALAFVAAMAVIIASFHTVTASNHDLKQRTVRLQSRIDEQAVTIKTLSDAVVEATSPKALAATEGLVDHAVLCIENHAANHRDPTVQLDPTCPKETP